MEERLARWVVGIFCLNYGWWWVCQGRRKGRGKRLLALPTYTTLKTCSTLFKESVSQSDKWVPGLMGFPFLVCLTKSKLFWVQCPCMTLLSKDGYFRLVEWLDGILETFPMKAIQESLFSNASIFPSVKWGNHTNCKGTLGGLTRWCHRVPVAVPGTWWVLSASRAKLPRGGSLSHSLRQAALPPTRSQGEPCAFLCLPRESFLFSSSHQSALSACCVQGFPQGAGRRCHTPSLLRWTCTLPAGGPGREFM